MDNDLALQDTYWNSVASNKTFSHEIDLVTWEKLVAKDARVLDIGCGYGRITNFLSSKGYCHVIGVDGSKEMIERGLTQSPELDLRVASALDLPFEDHSFDAVILFALITCIPPDEAQKKIFEEVSRILNASGVLYLSDYYLQSDPRCIARYEAFEGGPYGTFTTSDGAVFRHHSREWIAELLKEFEQIEHFEREVTTLNGNLARSFQFFGRRSV